MARFSSALRDGAGPRRYLGRRGCGVLARRRLDCARRRRGSRGQRLPRPGRCVSSLGDRAALPPLAAGALVAQRAALGSLLQLAFSFHRQFFIFLALRWGPVLFKQYRVQTQLPRKRCQVSCWCGLITLFPVIFMPPIPKFILAGRCDQGSTTDWLESFSWKVFPNTFLVILTCMLPNLGSQ